MAERYVSITAYPKCKLYGTIHIPEQPVDPEDPEKYFSVAKYINEHFEDIDWGKNQEDGTIYMEIDFGNQPLEYWAEDIHFKFKKDSKNFTSVGDQLENTKLIDENFSRCKCDRMASCSSPYKEVKVLHRQEEIQKEHPENNYSWYITK